MRNLFLNRRSLLPALAIMMAAGFCAVAAADKEGPLKEIPVTANMKMEARTGKVIRVKYDLIRLDIVDQKICNALIISPREISLIAMRKGSTDVTFWGKDASIKPTKIRIKVVPQKKK